MYDSGAMGSTGFNFCLVLFASTACRTGFACTQFNDRVCAASQAVFSCAEHRTAFLAALPSVASSCNVVDARWASAVNGEIGHCDADVAEAYTANRVHSSCPYAPTSSTIGGTKRFHSDTQTIVLSLVAFVYLVIDALVVRFFFYTNL